MGDKISNLINSINFKSNDSNIDLDGKVNKINKEITLVTNKMINGKNSKFKNINNYFFISLNFYFYFFRTSYCR